MRPCHDVGSLFLFILTNVCLFLCSANWCTSPCNTRLCFLSIFSQFVPILAIFPLTAIIIINIFYLYKICAFSTQILSVRYFEALAELVFFHLSMCDILFSYWVNKYILLKFWQCNVPAIDYFLRFFSFVISDFHVECVSSIL